MLGFDVPRIFGRAAKNRVFIDKGGISICKTAKKTVIQSQKWKDIIDEARKVNLADYLISKGVPLIRNGRRYKDKDHDSLVFTDNLYYWNKRQENGNAVDYLTRHMKFDFNGAVKELTGVDITSDIEIARYNQSEIKGIIPRRPFSMDDLTLENDMRRTAAYLNKTRYIDAAIIQRLIDTKLLYQQRANYRTNDGRNIEAHNIVFPIYDENRRIVGAETAGTLSYEGKRFKGIGR